MNSECCNTMRLPLKNFFVAGLLFALVGCVSRPAAEALQRFEFQKPEMGVPFRIILYAPNEAKANEAVAAAFKRIEQLNDIMSDYDPDSELSQLSKIAGQGKAVKLSDDLWRVLERAQKVSEQSDGAFDVTVGPVVQLWRKARREKKLPDPAALASARASVGYKLLQLNKSRQMAMLLARNMKLDLGGIAKGFANDEALKVLRRHGVSRALVTGGGDMAAGDPPPGKKGWRIELAPLDVINAPPTNFILLANCGFATSGDLFQHLEIDGKRYSHIVDPRTGIGLTDHSLVNVIARDSMTADSLSKPMSILSPQQGMALVKQYGAAARIARKPGDVVEVFETQDFRKFFDPHQ